MDSGGTEVRIAGRISSQLLAESLGFSTANLREILTGWSRCRALVEINRNLQLSSYLFAERAGESYAILHGGSLEGNERHDVGRANARMLAGMLAQIDVLSCDLDACQHSLHGGGHRRRATHH